MTRKRKSLFTFRKRSFLDPISTGHTSYILAEVESSDNGSYEFGNYLITMADCRRAIRLEFEIGNARNRRLSLKKIDLLIDVLARFRDAIQTEIEAIEKR